MNSQSTLELVNRAQTGDPEAFEVLAKRHEERLKALVHLRLGPRLRTRIETEDILQEVWKRAYQSIPRFVWVNERSVFRWLGGIVEHVILTEVRRHLKTKKRDCVRVVSLAAADEHSAGFQNRVPGRGTSPSKAMRRQERFDRLERALGSLTDEHREVVILAQVRGLSRREIGKRMGRSADAVSMLLLRALRQLRKVFGETDSLSLPPKTLDRPSTASGGAQPAVPQ